MTAPRIGRSSLPLSALSLLLLAACGSPSGAPQESPPDVVTIGEARAADGLTIAYDIRGRGDVALVFVHCWACDRTFWRQQLDAFADRYRVVSLDLPGHGDSGRERSEWTITGLATDVLAVADALDLERVVLVGHSMGGPVSLLAAPLLGSRLEGVICADTLHDAEQQMDPEMMEPILTRIREDYETFMTEAVHGMFPEAADPTLRDWITSRALTADRDATTELMADFPNFDPKAALTGAGVPIRCINAAPRPPAGPPTEVEANRRYADFDAVLMDGVGHYLMLERPPEFNEHLTHLLDELLAQ